MPSARTRSLFRPPREHAVVCGRRCPVKPTLRAGPVARKRPVSPAVDSGCGRRQALPERRFFIQTELVPLAMASAGLKKQYGAQVYSLP